MRVFKRIPRVFVFLFAAMFICAGALYFALPFFAQKLLTAVISETLHGADVSVRVRSFNINRLDLSGIRIGDNDNPALSIESVNCDYSLKGLLKRSIDRITISGLTVRAVVSEDGLKIPFLDIESGSESDSPITLPGAVNRLEVLNSTIMILWQDNTFHIPFSIMASALSPEKKSDLPSRYSAVLKAIPFNQEITIATDYDIVQAEGKVLIDVHELNLGVLSNAFAQFTGQTVSGFVNLSLAAEMNESGINLSSLEISNLALDYNGFEICLETGRKSWPSGIFIQTQTQGHNLSIKGLSVKQPAPLFINTDSEGFMIDIKEQGVKLSGNLLYGVEAGSFNKDFDMPVRLTRFPEGAFKIMAEVKNDGRWQIKASNPKPAHEYEIEAEDMNVVFSLKSLYMNAKGKGADVSAEFGMEISSATYSGNDLDMKIPSINYAGSFKMDGERGFVLGSVLKLKGDAFKTGDFYINDFEAEVPLRYPVEEPEKSAKGFIDIKKLRYWDYKLGSFYSEIYQLPAGLIFEGKAEPFTGTVFDVYGECIASLENGFFLKSDIKISDIEKYFEAGLDGVSRDFEGITLKGRLTAEARLEYERGVLTGQAWAKARGLDVVLSNEDMEINGIDLELEFEDLFELKTRPAQKAVFTGLRVGEIKTRSGGAIFRIESSDSLFIEKAHFGWAGGHVYTYTVRIIPSRGDIDFILFCDRLKLKDILNELQIAEADGEGNVSGRIPLSIKEGIIHIDDGFLYSAPGQGGSLKIKNTEVFDSLDQSLQISIAKDALKNFNYDWAKLTINTSGDTLFIPFQLYGRPGSPMYYVYDKKLGLRKSEGGGVQAKFEGIRFDINFTLPLNQLLSYKKGIDNLMKIN